MGVMRNGAIFNDKTVNSKSIVEIGRIVPFSISFFSSASIGIITVCNAFLNFWIRNVMFSDELFSPLLSENAGSCGFWQRDRKSVV